MTFLRKRTGGFFRSFLKDEGGGVMVYVAFFSFLAVGAGALAVDVGRLVVVKSQVQNRADAGALAGAVQLDGLPGAQARATTMAVDAMSDSSAITTGAGGLDVQSIQFYKSITPVREAATGDEDSKVIEVVMQPQEVQPVFEPLLLAFASGGASTSKNLNARASAMPTPFICHAPPLMICDPGETDSTLSLSDSANKGRQIQLKPSSGGDSWAPGNYGLLALPDGSVGASSIEGALAAVEPSDCYTLDVTTATGVKTNKVKNGINARFGTSTYPYPAPNVVNYPRDDDIESGAEDVVGSGSWDLAGYWAEKHGTPLPVELTDASRYQVYLYELGAEFARNGKDTYYPVEGDLPGDYTLISPAGPNLPTSTDYHDDPDHDGEPDEDDGDVASNGYERRLVKVAVLQCNAEGVKGSHSYPTDGRYLEMFVTQAVSDAPAGGIYGEIVRTLTTTNDPDFHANVTLVE